MPKAPERDTRGKIVELASAMMQEKSFNWLSFQHLADELSIKKASIHYHFPTKADLGVEMLRGYREAFGVWVTKVEAKAPDALTKLDSYVEMYRKILGNLDRLCPGGIFSVEWATLPKEMKDEMRGLYGDHRRFLDQMIREGRKRGEIVEQGSVDEQVAFVGAAMQGALQTARVMGNVAVFNSVSRQLKGLLSSKTNLDR